MARDLGFNVSDYINITFRDIDNTLISAEYEIAGLLNSVNPIISDGFIAINIHELNNMK